MDKLRSEKGSITVLTAILLMVLIVFMGFIIDATRLMYYKTKLTYAAFNAAETTAIGINSEFEKENGIIVLDMDLAQEEVERILQLNLPGAEISKFEMSTYGEVVKGELIATYEYKTVVLNIIGIDKKVLERKYIIQYKTLY